MGGDYERGLWVGTMGGDYGWGLWVGTMGGDYGWELCWGIVSLSSFDKQQHI